MLTIIDCLKMLRKNLTGMYNRQNWVFNIWKMGTLVRREPSGKKREAKVRGRINNVKLSENEFSQ